MSLFLMVKLAEIATPVARFTRVEPGRSYRTLGVKWWGQGVYERETIDGIQTAATSLLLVRTDDLIINKIWVRHGSVAIVPSTIDGCAASSEFPTFELDPIRVLPRWLHWYTKTRAFWKQCDDLSRGTSGKNRIRPDRFLSIKVPLPPLDEQQRIVARIEDLAAKVEEARDCQLEVAQASRQLLQGVFHEITERVSRMTMGEIAPLVRRSIQPVFDQRYPELGVRSFGKGTFHKDAISGAELSTKKIFQIQPGDLVFNIVFAWEGAVAVAQPQDEGRVGSHRFLTCVPDPNLVTSSFLEFYFTTEEGLAKLRDASPGGAGRNRTLGLKALERIEVPVPQLEEQFRFDAVRAQVDSAMRLQLEAKAELDAFLPSLLSKAFRGEL